MRREEEETEELRKMLRSADQTRKSYGEYRNSSDRQVNELASLLGAIDSGVGNERPSRPSLSSTTLPPQPPASSTTAGYSSRLSSDRTFRPSQAYDSDGNRPYYSDGVGSDEVSSTSNLSEAMKMKPVVDADSLDYTVIRFNKDYSVRGRVGTYLTTNIEEVAVENQNGANNSLIPQGGAIKGTNQKHISKTYLLGVNGQGIGEDIDCLQFVSIDNKEFEGPVKYGAILAIKSPASKERLLGLRDGNKLGFWRHVIGQGEKWQILKANTGLASSSGPSHYLGSEDMSARGKYVRVGDSLLIQTFKSDHFLSLNEGSTLEPKLIYKERTGLGSELWQIEVFGAVPLPSWYQNRPYLSGKYLVMPPALRTPAPEVEARVFPKSVNNNASFLQHTAQNSLNPLNEFHVSEQHYVLMRELLLLLSGIEGNYIRVAAAATSAGLNVSAKASQASRTYTVPEISHLPKVMDVKLIIDIDSADRSSATQVTQLLSICESVIKTRDFIKQHSRYEYGFVSHAMCSAIKAVMRDFDILVCQLEHLLNTNRLTLQKMVFLLQPSKVTMQVLEKLTTAVRELTGGHLLNVLYLGLLDQGDTKAKELYEHLLLKASEPFLKMLSLWIFRGELHDPYKEFMIAEDSSVSKDSLQEDFNAQYWDNRYTLNIKHIPKILSNHAQKALTAGKYLNVVRDCVGDYVVAASVASSAGPAAANASKGVLVSYNKSLKGSNKEEKFADLVLPKEQELILELERNDSTLTRAIEEAYQFSSQALLKLLESGYGLHSHFQSLGRFFLLEHGDFFIQFMDTAEEDLRREVKEIAISRVQNLLQLAVQTSTLATDAHREDLSCTLASHNLIQHLHLIQMAGESGSADIYTSLASQGLKGIEAFTLDYKVGWPLSIVLSRRAITKYQLLSRLLYFSKHVERRLLYSWSSHQTSKEFNVRGALGSSFCLRHRMLHFIQNFVYYITLEVINPRSHELEEEIVQATDMDQVLELHEKFLDACLKECLLASQDLLKILTKIMTTCLLFADHITRFMEDCEQQEVSSTPTRKTKSEPSPLGGADKKLSSTSSFRGNASTVADPQTIKEAAKLKVQQEKRRNRISDSTEVIQSETSHESFQRILAKFSTTFDEQLKEFLDHLWTNSYRHHVQLANLCVRLDYNGFYSTQFTSNNNY